MRHLKESLSDQEQLDVRAAAEELLSKGVSLFDGKGFQYPDLAVWLGFLRALQMIHHSHHWQTMGDDFYGDHLLLERLYKAAQDEIDTLGEKIVGVESPALTNYFAQLKHMHLFMKAVSERQDVMWESLKAEVLFIACGELIAQRLEEAGLLTRGVENLMGDMLDRHESHMYLLKQRIALRG